MIRLFHGTTSKKAQKIVGSQFLPREGFRFGYRDAVYFCEDIATARFFAGGRAAEADATAAQIRNPDGKPVVVTVIELTIPDDVAKELSLDEANRSPLGEFAGLSFPDVLHGSGFERIISDPTKLSRLNELLANGTINIRRLKYPRHDIEQDRSLI